ncbi:hypothetical protein S40285_03314 [Stachybotrys chlorohalonatus IBT 40285]|uniref:Uncharacterized protein n=1 Tax=Stachybotrys chlorohalonatus (strain IBT 40285) TaxID=1283841 RepID=A0A084R1M2_STAC4|nr:hypothetical protein S40285_03314 [Stachybotrys chlorohalonata IBT 40285]
MAPIRPFKVIVAGGQGGNGTMVTCAVLLNIIARMQRVKDIVSGSRDIQSLFAYENPLLSKLLLEVISPFQADDLMLDTCSGPPLFSIAVGLLSRIRLRRYASKQGPGHNEKDDDNDNANGKDHKTTADVPTLQSAHIFVAAIQGMAYLATLGYLINHPDFMMKDILFHQSQPHGSKWNISTISRVLDAFFKHEAVSFPASVSFYTIYIIFGLRQKGYLTTRDAIMATTTVVFGHMIIGPSATWAALWAWRKGVITGLSITM